MAAHAELYIYMGTRSLENRGAGLDPTFRNQDGVPLRLDPFPEPGFYHSVRSGYVDLTYALSVSLPVILCERCFEDYKLSFVSGLGMLRYFPSCWLHKTFHLIKLNGWIDQTLHLIVVTE